MPKKVTVDFTDGAKKPYTDVPDKVFDAPDGGSGAIVNRAKKDYPEKEVSTWVLEDGTPIIAPAIDTEIQSFTDFPDSFILSKNGKRVFTLGMCTPNNPVIAQQGLTNKDIVQNLKNITQKCLDPIKAKYPNMVISSGYRQTDYLERTGQVAKGKGNENSDHNIGCAIDIQFSQATSEEYVEIAMWIRDNIPHKQLLLEYTVSKKTNKLTSWIHISYQLKNGSLVKSKLIQYGTMLNGTTQAINGNGRFLKIAKNESNIYAPTA